MAEKRKYTPAHKKATMKWEKENIYRVTCKFPKTWEPEIRERAEMFHKGSVNAYLKNLVESDIFNSTAEEPCREVFFDLP